MRIEITRKHATHGRKYELPSSQRNGDCRGVIYNGTPDQESILLISISRGSSRFSTMETTNTTATTFAANTDWITEGKICHRSVSLAAVKPMPMARDREAIVIFL